MTPFQKAEVAAVFNWKPATPLHCAMYFICTTNLVATFRAMFPNDFAYAGNRAIVFPMDGQIPTKSLAVCIAKALTYRRDASVARRVSTRRPSAPMNAEMRRRRAPG